MFFNNRLKAFIFAFQGLAAAFKKEAALQLELLLFMLLLGVATFFDIKKNEWILIIICSALVFAAELFNTALEKTCDLIDENYSSKIKYIKDVSAGAVLTLVIASILIAIVIFLPYLIHPVN